MADDSFRLREVSWFEILPWLSLVRAVRIALSPQMLILAALAYVAMCAGWRAVAAGLYHESTDPLIKVWQAEDQLWPWETMPGSHTGRSVLADVLHGQTFVDPAANPVYAAWYKLSSPLVRMLNIELSLAAFTYLLLLAVWTLVVWALFGGAMARIAAVALAREDRLGFRAAGGFAAIKWPSLLGAPALPLIGVVLLAVPIALAGILMRWDVPLVVAAIVWPILLLIGFVIAILLVGLAFGWPLMWPTVAAEGTDSFDALSRSYQYTYQRPLHYLFYFLIASLLGIAAWWVVRLFVGLTIEATAWSAAWGAGGPRVADVVYGRTPDAGVSAYGIGHWLIGVFNGCVVTLGAGFVFSYFWSAATGIYFLLRHNVDGAELDEVAIDDEPESYGLPPLTSDGTTVQVQEPAANVQPPQEPPPPIS